MDKEFTKSYAINRITELNEQNERLKNWYGECEELKEWNIKVETEHEEMINEYETRIDKLERALIEEDWKHRQLPKQIVGKIRKEFIKQYYESISFDSDEFMRFFDTVLEEYQGDGE